MRLVMAPARARPPSESYASPAAISSAPRFAYPMPSCRYALVTSPILRVGKSAKQIEMSIAVMTNSHTLANFPTSKVRLSSPRNFSRLIEARLHDELSRWTYSAHGLDVVIRPDSGQVCHPLIVSSYWMPGSAQAHAAWHNLSHKACALTVSITSPVNRARRPNSPPPSTSRMNSSVTRTELLAFWYCTE